MRRLFLILVATASLHAQSTLADIQSRLIKKPLYLRGLWRNDDLKFDQDGLLQGTSLSMSFTLDGIEITKAKLTTDGLSLEGRRIGLTFTGAVPKRVVLQVGGLGGHDEKMHLDIAAPPSGDYSTALDAIFTDDLAQLIPKMPLQWQKFASKYFPAGSPPYAPEKARPAQDGSKRVGGTVMPPKVLFAPEPQFTAYAKALKQGGNCLVYLQVDTEGKPTNVSILRPIGLGLDEQSVVAVQSYKFTPAMENGQPVRVEMNVEVNFKIW